MACHERQIGKLPLQDCPQNNDVNLSLLSFFPKQEWEAKAAQAKENYEEAVKDFEANGGSTANGGGSAKKRGKAGKKPAKKSKKAESEDEDDDDESD